MKISNIISTIFLNTQRLQSIEGLSTKKFIKLFRSRRNDKASKEAHRLSKSTLTELGTKSALTMKLACAYLAGQSPAYSSKVQILKDLNKLVGIKNTVKTSVYKKIKKVKRNHEAKQLLGSLMS